jgi:hypothetical protein
MIRTEANAPYLQPPKGMNRRRWQSYDGHLRGGVGSEEAAAGNHHLAGIPSTFTPRVPGRKGSDKRSEERMSRR